MLTPIVWLLYGCEPAAPRGQRGIAGEKAHLKNLPLAPFRAVLKLERRGVPRGLVPEESRP